jgi:WD40 repeat protein
MMDNSYYNSKKKAERIIFHPIEKKLISFFNEDGITIWDENSTEEIGKIDVDKEGDKSIQYNSIVCSADGQFLAASNNSGKIFIWNFKNLELVKRLQVTDEKEDIKSVSFYPNLNNIIAFSTSDNIIILDTETEKVIEKLSIDNSFWAYFTPDGQSLLVASGGIVIKWNVIKKKIVENEPDI